MKEQKITLVVCMTYKECEYYLQQMLLQFKKIKEKEKINYNASHSVFEIENDNNINEVFMFITPYDYDKLRGLKLSNIIFEGTLKVFMDIANFSIK